jgi:hypothetical protein
MPEAAIHALCWPGECDLPLPQPLLIGKQGLRQGFCLVATGAVAGALMNPKHYTWRGRPKIGRVLDTPLDTFPCSEFEFADDAHCPHGT